MNLTQRRGNVLKKVIFHETQEIGNKTTSTNNSQPKGAMRLSNIIYIIDVTQT
jgi:hypothetical protein